MSKARIYAVHDTVGAKHTLVRAISASQAMQFVTTPRFAAAVATQDQLVSLLTNGGKVEDATVGKLAEQ